jgi:hypothetical protein
MDHPDRGDRFVVVEALHVECGEPNDRGSRRNPEQGVRRAGHRRETIKAAPPGHDE